MCLKNLTQFCVIACLVTVFLIYQSESRSFQFVHHKEVQKKCPINSYYDTRRERCRALPKGGEVLIIDYNKKCTKNYRGSKPHPTKKNYFYVCKNDSVVLGKCPEPQLFNPRAKQCEGGDSVPCVEGQDGTTCSTPGRFPVLSNCSQFYICDRDGRQYYRKVLQCPGSKNYNPLTQRCSYSYKCTPTTVYSTNSSVEDDSKDFPACKAPGRFRSPTNCALYFTCGLKKNGRFYQRRYRCPDGKLFDTTEKVCLEESMVKCEYTTASQLQLNNADTAKYNEESSEYTDSDTEDSLLDYFYNSNDTLSQQGTDTDKASERSAIEDREISQDRENVKVLGPRDEGSDALPNLDTPSEDQQNIPMKAATTEEVQPTKDGVEDLDERVAVDKILTDFMDKENAPESKKDAEAELEQLINEGIERVEEEKREEAKNGQSVPETSKGGSAKDQSSNPNIRGDTLNQDSSSLISGTVPETTSYLSPTNESANPKTKTATTEDKLAEKDQAALNGESNPGKIITSSIAEQTNGEGQGVVTTGAQAGYSSSQGEDVNQGVNSATASSGSASATAHTEAGVFQKGGSDGRIVTLTSEGSASATAHSEAGVFQKGESDGHLVSSTSEGSASAAANPDASLLQKGGSDGDRVPPTSEGSAAGTANVDETVFQKEGLDGHKVTSTSEGSAAGTANTDATEFQKEGSDGHKVTPPSDGSVSASANAEANVFQNGGSDGYLVSPTSEGSVSRTTNADATVFQKEGSDGHKVTPPSDGSVSASANAETNVFQNGGSDGHLVSPTSEGSVSATANADATVFQKEGSDGHIVPPTSEGSASATPNAHATVFEKGGSDGHILYSTSEGSASATANLEANVFQEVGSDGHEVSSYSEGGASASANVDLQKVTDGDGVSPSSEDSAAQNKALSSVATSTGQIGYSGQGVAYSRSEASSAVGTEIEDDTAIGLSNGSQTAEGAEITSSGNATPRNIAGNQMTNADQHGTVSIAQSSTSQAMATSVTSTLTAETIASASQTKISGSSESEYQDFLPDNDSGANRPSYSQIDQTVSAGNDYFSEETGYSDTRPPNSQSQAAINEMSSKMQIFYRQVNKSAIYTDGQTPKDEVLLNVFKPLRLVINFDPQGHPVQQVVGFAEGFP